MFSEVFAFEEASSFMHPHRIHNVVPGDFTHSGKLDLLVMGPSQIGGQLDMTLYPAQIGGGFSEIHLITLHPLYLTLVKMLAIR